MYIISKVAPWFTLRCSLIHSVIFIFGFPLARVAGAGRLEISHGQQQSQIVLPAPHQDGTNQCRRCNHSTWSLDDLLAACTWGSQQDVARQPFVGHSWHTTETKVAGISRFGREVAGHSGLYEFLVLRPQSDEANVELRSLNQSVYQSHRSAFRHW